MTEAIETTGPWVDVVFVDDWSAHVDGDESTAPAVELSRFLSAEDVQALADYLSGWDYGDETDSAHTSDRYSWGDSDDEYAVTVGGVDYVLAVAGMLDYVSLNRRPIGYRAGIVQTVTLPTLPWFAYETPSKSGESVADSDKYGALVWLDAMFTGHAGVRYVSGTWEDFTGIKTYAVLPMAEVTVTA